MRLTEKIAVLLIVALPVLAAAQADLRVDGDRLNRTMDEMKSFGGNDNGGSDRVAFSQHNADALEYLAALMRSAGLSVKTDLAGNLIGRRDGAGSNAAALISGSHIDTVPNGGHYDGIVGVMSAIEVARTMHDAGVELNHPLEIAAWTNEEGGKTGSRSIRGSVGSGVMSLPSFGDKKLGGGVKFLGGDPDRLAANARQPGSVAAYIEMHIEQGAILDRQQKMIGVVDGIVGIKRWYITIDGFANHAGTTPMDQRQDALLAAAQFIVAVRRIITDEPGRQVGTVGKIKAYPDTPNVVAGQVDLSLEIRDLSMDKVDMLFGRIDRAASAISEDTDTGFSIRQYYESPAADSDLRISDIVEQTADRLGLSSMHMPSGAGHDAQSFKGLAPLGMIFVPSFEGISHAPTEYTSPQQITNGANVLLQTLLAMDQIAWGRTTPGN
jgi:N-carbamoyl-L-amino-acid hydrolase